MLFDGADINALHRLIYFSRAKVSAADQIPAIMQSILSAAALRNAKLGISGVLLACDEWFVQALEGDRLKVSELYNLIRHDPRHRNPTIIIAAPVTTRKFGNWSMCGQTLSPTDDIIINMLHTAKSFDPADLSAPSALRLLEVVRDLQNKRPPIYL